MPARPQLRMQHPPGLPAALAHLRLPCYVLRTPRWMMLAVLLLALTLALSALAFVVWRAWQGRMDLGTWLLAAMLVPVLLAVLHPQARQGHVVLAADSRGLHFVGSEDDGDRITVSWREVGPIRVDRCGTRRQLVLPIAVDSDYWKPAMASTYMRQLLQAEDPPGYRSLPISRVLGASLEVAQLSLEALRTDRQTAPP